MIVGIKSKEELIRFIHNEPLIQTNHSLQGIENLSVIGAVYFGFGLCNRISLTQGLPIDALGMILVAELLAEEKTVLIADTHAQSNGFDKKSIERVASEQEKTVIKALCNLGFSGWDVIRVSSIDSTGSYNNLLGKISAPNSYIRRELADMVWLHEQKGVNLKLGWAIKESTSGEVEFDKRFREQFGGLLSFMYTHSGKTFDPLKVRSAPYLCIDPQARILLSSEEDVHSKIASARDRFGEKTMRPYEKLLGHILALYDKVVEPTTGSLQDRTQQVITRCMK